MSAAHFLFSLVFDWTSFVLLLYIRHVDGKRRPQEKKNLWKYETRHFFYNLKLSIKHSFRCACRWWRPVFWFNLTWTGFFFLKRLTFCPPSLCPPVKAPLTLLPLKPV